MSCTPVMERYEKNFGGRPQVAQTGCNAYQCTKLAFRICVGLNFPSERRICVGSQP